MKPGEIKASVRKHYRLLFEGENTCRLPIRKGKDLAETLGYPSNFLDLLAEEYWNWFVPCGNPLPFVHPTPGDRVLNVGCGVGIDSLGILSGDEPRVSIVNLDIVFTVVKRGRRLALEQGISETSLQWLCGDGESLPFKDESFSWIMMNGVFNLFPDKQPLITELHRVLRPSGRWVCTDLCCADSLPDYFSQEPDAWAWCMSGACTEGELEALLKEKGFLPIRMDRQEEGDWFHRVAFVCRKS